MLRDGHYWLVIDDKLIIAHEKSHQATVDIYRNLDDYERGNPSEIDRQIDLVVTSHGV